MNFVSHKEQLDVVEYLEHYCLNKMTHSGWEMLLLQLREGANLFLSDISNLLEALH